MKELPDATPIRKDGFQFFLKLPVELQIMIFQYVATGTHNPAGYQVHQDYNKLHIRLLTKASRSLPQTNRPSRATFLDCIKYYGIGLINAKKLHSGTPLPKPTFESTPQYHVELRLAARGRWRLNNYLLKDFRKWQPWRMKLGTKYEVRYNWRRLPSIRSSVFEAC